MARGLAALLSVALASVACAKVHVTFKAGSHETMGVYYVGNETMKRSDWSEKDFEVLSMILKPKEAMTMDLSFEHAFVVRSSDHQFRAKVTVEESPQENRAVHPFSLIVGNIMHEVPDRPMHERPVKIVTFAHKDLPEIKIAPGQKEGLFSDIGHWYDINMQDDIMFSMQLGHPPKEEL